MAKNEPHPCTTHSAFGLHPLTACSQLHQVALVLTTGVKRSRRTNAPKGFQKDDKDEAECAICHLYLHVSGLECDCCPGRRVCLQHADNLCECDPTRWRLVYRYSLQDLDGVLKRVSARIPQECTAYSSAPICICGSRRQLNPHTCHILHSTSHIQHP